MLARYQIRRGVRVEVLDEPVRRGIRQDSRMHTRHVLRPLREQVERYLAEAGTERGWSRFSRAYAQTLEARFQADRTPFDALAQLASDQDVFLGCSCPTERVPSVRRCHTWVALTFMAARYPELEVRFPEQGRSSTA